MENEVILSIVIPCYNAEKYIGNLLGHLITENLNYCEILVINDGSTDMSEKIISTYPGVTLINQIHQGVSVARNVGIEKSIGKYVWFLDADDGFYDDSISVMVSTIINSEGEHPDIISWGYESRVRDRITQNYSWGKYKNRTFSRLEINQLYLKKQICLHICSMIFSRDFLERNKLYFTPGLRIGEDVEFILYALDQVNCLKYYAKKCFIYNIHPDSTMKGYQSYSLRQFESLEVNVNTVEILLNSKNNIQLKKEYSFFLLNSYFSNLIYYLRSSEKNSKINEGFLKYAYITKYKIPMGNWKRFVILKVLSCIPIKILLRGKC